MVYAFEGSPGREVNSVLFGEHQPRDGNFHRVVPDWYEDMCLYQRLGDLASLTTKKGRLTRHVGTSRPLVARGAL